MPGKVFQFHVLNYKHLFIAAVLKGSDYNFRCVVINMDSKHFGKLFIKGVEIETHMVVSIIPFRACQKELVASPQPSRPPPPETSGS